MARKAAYTSILSLFLISELTAQRGLGCVQTTCSIAGQVRIDVILDSYGNYAGGCNCGCDPLVPCNPPNILNFDAMSGLGDCSCHAPQSPPSPPSPIMPLPSPPRAIVSEVLCDTDRGKCQCPVGHVGECRIRCEGPDACKDANIHCNNDGYGCFVDCISENSCGGSSSIMGPVNGALTVTCFGEKACEGHTQIDGEAGTDLSVTCDGDTSCKDAEFNFGSGVGRVACNAPDACSGAVFNLLRDVASIPGAAFSCVGTECPRNAPAAFNNAVAIPATPEQPLPVPVVPIPAVPVTTTPAPTIRLSNTPFVCSQPGACSCQNAEPSACKITCDGANDACKDGLIECNSDGFDCVVDCVSPDSCSGRSTISGPVGASLTVNCIGEQSCSGSTIVEGWAGSDLHVNCAGGSACKGSDVVFIFGSGGVNTVSCSGSPDSCKDVSFVLPPQASSTVGMAFSCVGVNCPVQHGTFNNAAAPPAVGTVTQRPVIVQPPTEHPINALVASSYCCRTSIPNFKPLRGRCWDETTAAGCAAEPAGRCRWDANNCLPDPPVNTMVNTPCQFTYSACTEDSHCCSETCHAGNICG